MATNSFGQTYSGNDDFRGWLAANGGQNLLSVVGNDGGINATKAQAMLGTFGPYRDVNAVQSAAQSKYGEWANARQSGPAQGGYGYGSGGSGGGGGGGGSASQPDPEAVAYWNDQEKSLQRLLNSSNIQKKQGLTSLTNSYNRNLSDVNDQESRTMRDYLVKSEDTQRERQGALRTIDTSARQGNEGLQRLFQLSGSAGGSAARLVAPTAVARDASTKRTGALETFGKNTRNIDLAKEDATAQFGRSRRDLSSQRREKEQSFIEGILNLQNDLNSKLSNVVTQRGIAQGGKYSGLADERARYDNAIKSNQNQLNSIFNKYRDPTYKVAPVNVQAPDLGQYTVDPTAIDLAAQNPGIPEELLPYLPQLKEDGGLRSLLA